MKRKIKGILFCLLAIFVSGKVTSVSAKELNNQEIEVETVVVDVDVDSLVETEENVGLQEYAPSYAIDEDINPGYQTRGTSKPSRSTKWNLATQGQRTISGASSYTVLYSNYNFTGTSRMNVSITPTKVGDVTYKVYKNNLLTDTLIGTYTAKYGKMTMHIFKNLDSDGLYYLKFEVPCYFNGYVVEGA